MTEKIEVRLSDFIVAGLAVKSPRPILKSVAVTDLPIDPADPEGETAPFFVSTNAYALHMERVPAYLQIPAGVYAVENGHATPADDGNPFPGFRFLINPALDAERGDAPDYKRVRLFNPGSFVQNLDKFQRLNKTAVKAITDRPNGETGGTAHHATIRVTYNEHGIVNAGYVGLIVTDAVKPMLQNQNPDRDECLITVNPWLLFNALHDNRDLYVTGLTFGPNGETMIRDGRQVRGPILHIADHAVPCQARRRAIIMPTYSGF